MVRIGSVTDVCNPPKMSETAIVDVPNERLDDLEPLWRALYDHHNDMTLPAALRGSSR